MISLGSLTIKAETIPPATCSTVKRCGPLKSRSNDGARGRRHADGATVFSLPPTPAILWPRRTRSGNVVNLPRCRPTAFPEDGERCKGAFSMWPMWPGAIYCNVGVSHAASTRIHHPRRKRRRCVPSSANRLSTKKSCRKFRRAALPGPRYLVTLKTKKNRTCVQPHSRSSLFFAERLVERKWL